MENLIKYFRFGKECFEGNHQDPNVVFLGLDKYFINLFETKFKITIIIIISIVFIININIIVVVGNYCVNTTHALPTIII